ncbi:MAG: hypothetical protein DRH56_05580 [Deltaproteobacteria bacterium]|nr:MAG: hypothetical protein DRH56_05580 [Deltaproteobacteria bacterium]
MEEITYKQFKKCMESLIESHMEELKYEMQDYIQYMTPDIYERIQNTVKIIDENEDILREGERHKDDALFFIQNDLPTYRIIGRELKRRHENKKKESDFSYA